eukprot:NODE_3814_length_631_cov_102.549828_g2731_i1.p4 GENE.NODE_3814_length_631_cov_102.549828_g2731_i1~~NODE_3814_length_631_cov_102.549828_g2731_i1.p4  ORF type:complete len:62 (+),score=5.60 NODE_3814_length_631_cov_102.549828_g2731_i1:222-407(+)
MWVYICVYIFARMNIYIYMWMCICVYIPRVSLFLCPHTHIFDAMCRCIDSCILNVFFFTYM